ncbi:MAG: Gfo/Idh/MocA family oxidoreductase [Betaproteobacteria bacterium]|nr:Gfo/Idh/MocA family oxidoreductase [Betaproteobacteria bacterium]
MKPFGWALIGPGRIAHRFAEAVQGTDGAALIATQGRDLGRSTAFAQKWSRPGKPVAAVADIAALLKDDRVDGIYVATPHAFHAGAVRQCLVAGKPVLCEKPLVPHHAAGAELVVIARRHKVFLMEAVWTRFLPIYAEVGKWLTEGAIGKVRAIQSCFCFNSPFDPKNRNYDPDQAGGSLLDLGVYNLTMTRWTLATAMGKCPELRSLQASGVLAPTGVDHRISATLEFAEGVVSQFSCGFNMSSDNGFRIFGEQGAIVMASRFWEGTQAELQIAGKDPVVVQRPFRINGFEYEIEEAMKLIRAGEIEGPVISHAETLETLQWMDRIRGLVGVSYPFESDSK